MLHFHPSSAALSLIEVGGFSVEDLWLQYYARGGSAGVLELDAFIHDIPLLHGLEVEILQVTLDELLSHHAMTQDRLADPGRNSAYAPLPESPHQAAKDSPRHPIRLAVRSCPAALNNIAAMLWRCVNPRNKHEQ